MRCVIILCLFSCSMLMGMVHGAAIDNRLAALLAALTDSRRSVHESAMQGLVLYGDKALPQLAVMAKDPNAGLRSRVALVVGGIGGKDSLPILRLLTEDRASDVVELAVLSLGQTRSKGAYEIVRPFIRHELTAVRDSAALALGALGDPRAIYDLSFWQEGGGDLHKIQFKEQTISGRERELRRVKANMQAGLNSLVGRAINVPHTIDYLGKLRGVALQSLLEATWRLADPRLCPVLVMILRERARPARVMAAVSLTSNGDSRAVEDLVALAVTGSDDLTRTSAQALKFLTGYEASAGKAWELWWQDKKTDVLALHERDAFIAKLHDAKYLPTRAELAAFTPDELWPLVHGTRGDGALWWPRLAWRAIRLDDPKRWTQTICDRFDRSRDEREKVLCIVLLDSLGDPAARTEIQTRYEDLRDLTQATPQMRGSLWSAMELALQRQARSLPAGN